MDRVGARQHTDLDRVDFEIGEDRIDLRGDGLCPGRIYTARVTRADGYDLHGEVVSATSGARAS